LFSFCPNAQRPVGIVFVSKRTLVRKCESDHTKKREGGEKNEHGGAEIQSFLFLHGKFLRNYFAQIPAKLRLKPTSTKLITHGSKTHADFLKGFFGVSS
jgi:hypothetical protein